MRGLSGCLSGPSSVAAVVTLAALAVAVPVRAQPRADLGVVPVRVVNGHLIVFADLVGLQYQDEVSLEISLEYPAAITLHPDQYHWLGMDPDALERGDEIVITLQMGQGITWSIPGRDIVPERSPERVAAQNSMTKLHSSALGERKLKGTIGVGFLRQYHVTLDVQHGQMVLAPPRAVDDVSPSFPLADIAVSPFDDTDNRLQIGLQYADDRTGRMTIGGTEYDTVIDAAVARDLERPAGNVSPVWLAENGESERTLDLSRYLAFRPKVLGSTGAAETDRPVIVTGVNLLEHFRVEIDWANRSIGFTQTKAPQYPQQDFEFFQAEVQGNADAMRAYLEKHPRERLSPDAARLLVAWRLEKDKANDEQLMEALRWVVDTSPPGRRAETCLFYVDVFTTVPDRAELAIAAAKEGLKHSREAVDVTRVYGLHNALGEQYVKKGDLTQAWKHFLASAFMMPDDIMTSLNLARVYDRQGRTRRAYARYKRVAAAEHLGDVIDGEVKAAMERLRSELPKDDLLLSDGKAVKKP